jgi:hypothetical protein
MLLLYISELKSERNKIWRLWSIPTEGTGKKLMSNLIYIDMKAENLNSERDNDGKEARFLVVLKSIALVIGFTAALYAFLCLMKVVHSRLTIDAFFLFIYTNLLLLTLSGSSHASQSFKCLLYLIYILTIVIVLACQI